MIQPDEKPDIFDTIDGVITWKYFGPFLVALWSFILYAIIRA